MFHTFVRIAVRSALLNNGPQTCSEIVRGMGMDPKRHKGTIHAVMVDLERDGQLWAEINPISGKRSKWHFDVDHIRKRDRLAAVFM